MTIIGGLVLSCFCMGLSFCGMLLCDHQYTTTEHYATLWHSLYVVSRLFLGFWFAIVLIIIYVAIILGMNLIRYT